MKCLVAVGVFSGRWNELCERIYFVKKTSLFGFDQLLVEAENYTSKPFGCFGQHRSLRSLQKFLVVIFVAES